MSKNTYDRLKIVQLILPDILSLYSIIDSIFGWNTMPVVVKIVPIITSILGHLLKADSDEYFSTRSIVNKIVPDNTEEE